MTLRKRLATGGGTGTEPIYIACGCIYADTDKNDVLYMAVPVDPDPGCGG
ncbi:hypothetical protein PV797_07555 [Clostridiaceae bacterium M8S5]|nr:hypothetical protein PV797_07555 [Clostridiaceae bacterium M8S5]